MSWTQANLYFMRLYEEGQKQLKTAIDECSRNEYKDC